MTRTERCNGNIRKDINQRVSGTKRRNGQLYRWTGTIGPSGKVIGKSFTLIS